jgi:hypothetical protein
MRGLILLFFFVLITFGEESWFTTIHQIAQRQKLDHQNELKQNALNIKEKMHSSLRQIVVELQLLNANIAKMMMEKTATTNQE